MPEEPKFYESKKQLDEAIKASESSTPSLTPLQRDALVAQTSTIFYRSADARALILQIGISSPSHSKALYAIQDVLEASRKLALYLNAPLPLDLPSQPLSSERP